MTTFQFGLVVAMLLVVMTEATLALIGLEKIHQEIGDEHADDEEGEGDRVLDDGAR